MKVPMGVFEGSWECFWDHLEGLKAVLGVSWASWGHLDGVLVIWECLGARKSVRPSLRVREQGQDLRLHGQVRIHLRGWGRS